jgi:hypothetical protein
MMCHSPTQVAPTFSIVLAPAFPGLRRFPQGRGFKQWMGNDSKALMKVSNSFPVEIVTWLITP